MGVDSGLAGLPRQRGVLGTRIRRWAASASTSRRSPRPTPSRAIRVAPGGSTATGSRCTARTVPHAGFAMLRRWRERAPHGAFVFTSNVDGQFQKAGTPPDRVVECHGSIHHLQCLERCAGAIWPADRFVPDVDEAACRLVNDAARAAPPAADSRRPNVLMFGDWGWLAARAHAQEARLEAWLARVASPGRHRARRRRRHPVGARFRRRRGHRTTAARSCGSIRASPRSSAATASACATARSPDSRRSTRRSPPADASADPIARADRAADHADVRAAARIRRCRRAGWRAARNRRSPASRRAPPGRCRRRRASAAPQSADSALRSVLRRWPNARGDDVGEQRLVGDRRLRRAERRQPRHRGIDLRRRRERARRHDEQAPHARTSPAASR